MSESNGHVKEEPTRQFQGTWAPAELHEKVEKGEISATAAWLAMVIQSLSKRDGCYASNEFLAQQIHKRERQVCRLLGELESAGLLESHWIGKKRLLWIKYDNEPRQARNQAYRAEARHDQSRLRHVKNDMSDMSKMTCQKAASSIVLKDLDYKCCTAKPCNRVNGFFSGKSVTSSEDLNLATLLHNTLLKQGLITAGRYHVSAWAKWFTKLRGIHGDKVREVLIGYLPHANERYWHKVRSGRSFFEKYDGIKEKLNELSFPKGASNGHSHSLSSRIKENRDGRIVFVTDVKITPLNFDRVLEGGKNYIVDPATDKARLLQESDRHYVQRGF